MANAEERANMATARPKTSVTITDLGVKRANPKPRVCEEVELLLEEYLSPRKLKALTGMDDLTKVRCLQLRVDTTETSLGNFGTFLPNLQELKIKDGVVPSIRDLGSSLGSVQVLWMPRCSLREMDGISSLENLAELFIAYNDVSELSPLTLLDNLRLLDLEGNNVDDLKQLEYLAFCPTLATLSLDGNPVVSAQKKQNGVKKFRQLVKKLIPQLRSLDDVPFDQTDDEHGAENDNKPVNEFEDDWNYINTFVFADSASADSALALSALTPASEVPSTASSCSSSVHTPLPRPTTGYRPGSALKPSSADKHRQLRTARLNAQSPQTAVRPPTAVPTRPHSEDMNLLKEAASELTMGDVVCGNPAKSLRSRARTSRCSLLSLSPVTMATPDASTSRSTGTADSGLDERTQRLFDEAHSFSKQHESTRRMIEQDRAPQVLKIDFSEDGLLSEQANAQDEFSDDESQDPAPESTRLLASSLPGNSARELPPPASPAGALNPLKVPTPPARNNAACRNRPYVPTGKGKQIVLVPIPPPFENTRPPATVLLPSKLYASKLTADN